VRSEFKIEMSPEARQVRLGPKMRKVLEVRCRAPTAARRDVKGRSTRPTAEEVRVQPRTVNNWLGRFSDYGLWEAEACLEQATSRRPVPGLLLEINASNRDPDGSLMEFISYRPRA
jgi:hypothetical protein